MDYKIKKTIVFVFFLGLLASPILIQQFVSTPANSKAQQGQTQDSRSFALDNFHFYLENITESAGISFKHQSPRLDPKLDHILPIIASMGAGVAVSDFNRDGWNDFYVTNSRYGTRNALYLNKQDGRFEDVASDMGIGAINQAGTGVSMGAVWGDYDNDGHEDLFVYKWGKSILFHNDQGKGFTERTDAVPLPEWMNANTAIWFDYNADGHLDLFVGGYYPEDINLWDLKTTRIMPESFEYANNGGKNYLFRNNGDGTFTNVTEAVGFNSTRWTLAAGAVDLTGDKYPDLYIANDFGVDEFYENVEGKRFRNIGDAAGVSAIPKSGMNVSFGDIENSGHLGIYVTNITARGVLLQGNSFWNPISSGKNGVRSYKNQAGNRGIELGGWSYGAQFGDLNNDGAQDLYVANGYISGKKGTSYWYDYSKITGANKQIISDAKNWPAMDGRSQSGFQRNRIWLNDGQGYFQEVAAMVGGEDPMDSRAVAFADLWNRGVLDVIVANQSGELMVYKNNVTGDHHWIGFELQGAASNRSAIGATITLQSENSRQSRVITGGIGYCSQNQRRTYFGLGEHPEVENVTIRWPSGTIQELRDYRIDTLHTVTEPLPS